MQYRKNKYHQENVRKSLDTVRDYILNTPKSRKLRLDLDTKNENECDLAVLPLRSPMLSSASDDNAGNDASATRTVNGLPTICLAGTPGCIDAITVRAPDPVNVAEF